MLVPFIIPVSWEMLRRGEQALRMDAAQEFKRHRFHFFRIVAKRAVRNHGVMEIVMDIHDRGKNRIDAHHGRFFG